jgi:hypothetical protein
LVSTAFYLAALGPALNKPAFWTKSEGGEIRSRLFYDFIGRIDIDRWRDYWTNTPVEHLRTKFTQDYVQETWFLAEKAYAKFYWMSFGSIFFRLGLVAFILFIATLFSADITLVRFLATAGAIALGSVFAFERITRPPRPQRKDMTRGWLFWLMTFLGVLIAFLPLIAVQARAITFELLTLGWGITLCGYTFYVRAAERQFNDDKWGILSAVGALSLLLFGPLLLGYKL